MLQPFAATDRNFTSVSPFCQQLLKTFFTGHKRKVTVYRFSCRHGSCIRKLRINWNNTEKRPQKVGLLPASCRRFLRFQISFWQAAALMVHISLNDLQTRKLLTFFFFEGVADILYENRIRWNRYIFQGVCTLLRLADIHCKTVGGVFHHGQADGQLLYL